MKENGKKNLEQQTLDKVSKKKCEKEWKKMDKKRKLYKERIKTFIPYLTSFSDCAIIQYTLERFRLEPNAINWFTEQPSGMGGLLGIWPVQWAIANISGASLTSIFPLGDAFPGSYNLNNLYFTFNKEWRINLWIL